MRPYLSWIEGLTTNQNAAGSNPAGRTISKLQTKQALGFFRFIQLVVRLSLEKI